MAISYAYGDFVSDVVQSNQAPHSIGLTALTTGTESDVVVADDTYGRRLTGRRELVDVYRLSGLAHDDEDRLAVLTLPLDFLPSVSRYQNCTKAFQHTLHPRSHSQQVDQAREGNQALVHNKSSPELYRPLSVEAI